MGTWQDRLSTLVGRRDDLPGGVGEWFEVRPPSRKRWPKGLPACPPLVEFYAICGGGNFHPYDIVPLGEVEDETASWIGLGDDDEGRVDLSEAFVFGFHSEVNHALVWDGARDRVGRYSPDDGWIFDQEGGWDFLGLGMAAFLEALFTPPSRPVGEAAEAWTGLLRCAEEGA